MARSKGQVRGGKVLGMIGVAGAALTAWYFLDPKNGRQRRKKFAKGAKNMYSSAEREIKKIGNEAAKGLSSAVDRTSDLARNGLERVSDASHNAAEGARKIGEKAKSKLNAR